MRGLKPLRPDETLMLLVLPAQPAHALDTWPQSSVPAVAHAQGMQATPAGARAACIQASQPRADHHALVIMSIMRARQAGSQRALLVPCATASLDAIIDWEAPSMSKCSLRP